MGCWSACSTAIGSRVNKWKQLLMLERFNMQLDTITIGLIIAITVAMIVIALLVAWMINYKGE